MRQNLQLNIYGKQWFYSLSVKKTCAALYLGAFGSLKSSIRPSTDWNNKDQSLTLQTGRRETVVKLIIKCLIETELQWWSITVIIYLIWGCDQVDGLHAGQRFTPLGYIFYNWGTQAMLRTHHTTTNEFYYTRILLNNGGVLAFS